MAHFDRVIPPGGEGKVTISVRTEGYHGLLEKSARVFTNDPRNRVVVLNLKAFVRSLIHVSTNPLYIYMTDASHVTRVVRVGAGLDKPLKLSATFFDLSEKLTYSLKEVEKGRQFEIRFHTVPGTSQEDYMGYLILATNYPEKPEIVLKIYGLFTKEQSERQGAWQQAQ